MNLIRSAQTVGLCRDLAEVTFTVHNTQTQVQLILSLSYYMHQFGTTRERLGIKREVNIPFLSASHTVLLTLIYNKMKHIKIAFSPIIY